jgi:hypothetical protein
MCIPPYAPSLATFHHAYALMDGVGALMPPQGVLVIAAYMPQAWEVRLVDENVRPASRSELAWADAIFVSGMHIQRGEISAIARRARALGKTTVLGGPWFRQLAGAQRENDRRAIRRGRAGRPRYLGGCTAARLLS